MTSAFPDRLCQVESQKFTLIKPQPGRALLNVTLRNRYDGQFRRLAARLDIALARGGTITSWRRGSASIAPGSVFATTWNQPIPAAGALLGTSIFSMAVEDVTPAPYNQPPYPPSGDTDLELCTVTGVAP